MFESRFCNKGTTLVGPQMAQKKLGFSPCYIYFQLFALPQRLKPRFLMGYIWPD
jgi:hypothetical protein